MRKRALVVVLAGLAGAAFAAPTTWVQAVTNGTDTITMRLTKETLRGANFEFWSQNTNGTYDVITPVPERSYMGTVDGYPGAVSCGILKDDGTFWGVVYFDRGETWYTLGSSVYMTRGVDYHQFNDFRSPTHPSVGAGQAGTDMMAYDVGVDVDYDYFTQTGGVAASLEGIEFSVCVVRALYMRDALLRQYLGRVIVRSTLAHDPYTGLTQGDYLGALAAEWNNNHTDADRDLVVGASPTKIGGGLAWVGVVGTGSGYSVNDTFADGNFTVVWRHEMGHNWGCWHSVGDNPEGSGLMGGNTPGRFSGPEVNVVLSHRDSRSVGVLDNEGTYTTIELPPYASLDAGEFIQTVTPSLTFDVTANDHDANGQAVSLTTFDSASANGGTVIQSGRNLIYTAPGAFLGTDYFLYTITDTAGRTATGAVVVNVKRNMKWMHLPLDETTGTTAGDFSMFVKDGTLLSNDFPTVTAPGRHGNAIDLDGVSAHVEVPIEPLSANAVTLTAWVKPGTSPNAWSGIVFDRSSGASGLNLGNAGELRYHWNNSSSTYNWHSGLVPPANTWSFVALVVEPDRAIIHMDSGSGLQSATNHVAHAAGSFGTVNIGRDPVSASRYYDGAIDDVRIYNHALSEVELLDVLSGSSGMVGSPFDGAYDVQLPEASWSPGFGATSYEVYLGTNETAVAGANTGSPEYLGSTTNTDWTFDLETNTTYFWRIDTATATSNIAGTVWSFMTAGHVFEPGLVAHWKLDDGAGAETVTDSSQNNNIGTLYGPVWTNGFDNGALSFDGVDDSVTFGSGPSLDGSTDFTVSAWIKTSSATEQVIVQQRDSHGYDGVYVFKVLSDGRLHFNIYSGGGSQYSFATTDTVSDGQWHYVAAVRDGDNGYIYIDGNPVAAATASGTVRNLNGAIGVGMGRNIRDSNSTFNGMIDETKIYTLAKSGVDLAQSYNAYVGGTNAPAWNTNPVIEIAASEGAVYSAALADDATDADGHGLFFSKVAGSAWLNVALDGTLSGTPGPGDLGPNSWTVEVTDGTTAPVSAALNIVVGTSVSIANYSFELPGTVKQTNWESVPGWSSDTVAADSGVETGQGATEGSWTGFLGSSDPSVWNLTDHVIATGEVHTLRVDAKNTGGGTSLRIMLYYDNAGSRTTLATFDAALDDGMQEFVLQFNADDVPASIGRRIGIEIDNVFGGWAGFDNVRLTSVLSDLDSDGDGMPNDWELANGLNPNVDDSAAHSDSDTYDNWTEYVTDTDPQDGGSYQTFSMEPATGDPMVRFSSSASRLYVVEYRDSLTEGSWQNLGPASPGNGGEMSVSDSSAGTNRFYRLRIELP